MKDNTPQFTESIAAVQNHAQKLLDESRMKLETLEALIEQNNRHSVAGVFSPAGSGVFGVDVIEKSCPSSLSC